MVSTAKLFCQLYWIIEIATCKNSNHVEKKQNKYDQICVTTFPKCFDFQSTVG